MSQFSSNILRRGNHSRVATRDTETAMQQTVRPRMHACRHAAMPRDALGSEGLRSVATRALMTSQELASNAYSVASTSYAPAPPSIGKDLGWNTAFKQHYSVSNLLGQGSFGLVHQGTRLTSGESVAVKIMPKERSNIPKERLIERLAREIDILERLQVCESVVRLDGCFEDEENVQIVMEVCQGGDLQGHVETHGVLDERALAAVSVEILKILGACHNLGILHGDVKPANFCLKDAHHNPLFSADPELATLPWIKALDFGCSQNLRGSKRLFKRSGTPVYMAPEIYGRDYGHAADMWSLGVSLYWMFAGRFPFFSDAETTRSAKLEDVMEAVNHAPIPMDYGVWQGMSAPGLDFMSRCLERDESSRMTVQEALQHPWLHDAVAASTSFGLY
eukprot:gene28394-31530_t